MVSDDNFDPVETRLAEYFGCKVEVWRIKGPYWGSYPWRYAVTYSGQRREFSGVPNYLETKKAALKKAWWRAKWMHDGSFSERYKLTTNPTE